MVTTLQKTEALLQIKNLKKYFLLRSGFFKITGYIRAVDGVTLEIPRGTTMGLVGESGCGKTTVGLCILRLIKASSGQVIFDGTDLLRLNEEGIRPFRSRMGLVFQRPFLSLNPRRSVEKTLSIPLKLHTNLRGCAMQNRILELLSRVGLEREHLRRYPHELSGGQCQRIAIARAISINPHFLILDEPTSALDVSVQAQILNLLLDIQEQLELTYLFISHDLSVIEHISDNIAVMYLGRIVEKGPLKEVFSNPLHPYAQALFRAIPIPRLGTKRERIPLRGEVPSPQNPPRGCHFHPRCPHAQAICSEREPEFREVHPAHFVTCHLY